MRTATAALTALVLSATAVAQAQLQFRPLATIDLASTSISTNPQFIGSRPSAVAWDGATLVVAGFNGGTATANTGLVRLSNVFGTPTASAPVISAAFGVTSTPPGLGYSGIASQGGKIAAAFDSGATSANGIALFNADGTRAWQASYRGSAGTDFDPGVGGLGAGVNVLTGGWDRRALVNPVSGQWIYTSTTGAQLTLNPNTTGWRDHAFDPATGDLFARNNNDVTRHLRTGANTFAPNLRIVDVTDAPNVVGQNIEFMDTVFGKLLVYNDRGSTAATTLANCVKFIDTNGVQRTYSLGGLAPAASDGHYDFSWDTLNDRLAILDSSNLKLHILQLCDGIDSNGNGVQDCFDSPPCCTGNVTTYCTAGTAVLGCVPQISGLGIPSVDAASGFEISVEFVPPQRQGLVFYGFYAASQPWAPFNPSYLCVAPPVQRMGSMSSGGTLGQCNGQLGLDFNVWRAANPASLGAPLAPGQTLRAQGWYRDPAAPGQTNLSDALQFTLCSGSGETAPPTILSCANDLTVSTGTNNCVGVVPDLRSQVVVVDNCTAVTVSQVPAPGSTVGIGTLPIVLRARDAFQNAVTCSAVLTVVDGVPPTIQQCAASQSVMANGNCQALVPNFTAGVVATDVCSLPVTVTQSPAVGAVVSLGLTTVIITVTDAAGNFTTCSTNLTVLPSPQCPLPPTPPGFVAIQPGTFQMGQAGVADPVHSVTISYPFFMAAKEVTQAEYGARMASNPSFFFGPSLPVERVTWHNARAYCAVLNSQQAGSLPVGYEYRLPTEAEWEYACRAGTTTPWNVGNVFDCSNANFRPTTNSPCVGQPAPVGNYAPNAWGLFDMHGNVWEWCLDSFAGYPASAVTSPFVTGTGLRIFRGGSWNDNSSFCRSAFRNGEDPAANWNFIGFRVVLGPIFVP